MMVRIYLAGFALAMFAPASDAGPFRRWVARHSHHAPVSRVYPANVSSSVPAPTYRTSGAAVQSGGQEGDGLAEVNARRARSGLPPLLRDEGLSRAARDCAAYRAARLMFGHVTHGMGDFAFCRYGSMARFTGCAAYTAEYGWLSCGVEDRTATHAGAWYVVGADNKRYMSTFYR